MIKTPILFLVFNRLDTTKKVFKAIRQVKPPRLYVAADGPRLAIEGESEKAKEVRDYVLNNIDWQCEVKTLFRSKNLGCGKAVSEAITWFFENEEMGIVLEDDCVPNQSFFGFCENLLKKYKDDERVMMIAGTNYFFGKESSEFDYYFSRYFSIWGWATWKRAWKLYDFNMKELDAFIEKGFFKSKNNFADKRMGKFYEKMFLTMRRSKIDTWDIQWVYSCLINSGFSITPIKNLISNIGYEGTHTDPNGKFLTCEMPVYPIDNEQMKHPSYVQHGYVLDRKLLDFFGELRMSIFKRGKNKFWKLFSYIAKFIFVK
jgi:hypothetical protein